MASITKERHDHCQVLYEGNPPLHQQLLRTICALPARTEASAIVLGTMWLFIAAVSAVDVYCSIKYEFELVAEELNPIGRWLMQLDGGSVGLFMSCKFLGNLVALGVLQLLYSLHRPLCLLAASVLTVVQGCLALMLLW